MRNSKGFFLWALALLSAASPAAAQRRFRVGPILSSISIENGNGVASGYRGFGGTIALLIGDYDETGLVVARYKRPVG